MAKLYIGRRRTRRNRLPRSALKQLKIKKFVKGDPWEVCAICLDDYEVGAKLRILPCDHGLLFLALCLFLHFVNVFISSVSHEMH